MTFETFEYDGDDSTIPDDMDGWFEVFEVEKNEAWVASDTTMEVRR